MQREFISVAAHELRTLVQPILGIAEIMEEDQMLGRHAKTVDINDNNDEVLLSRDDFDMLIRDARRLERLSSDILEVAGIESQSLKLERHDSGDSKT